MFARLDPFGLALERLCKRLLLSQHLGSFPHTKPAFEEKTGLVDTDAFGLRITKENKDVPNSDEAYVQGVGAVSQERLELG